MKKNIFLPTCLVVSILFTLVLALLYYDIIREICIYIFSLDYYIKKYSLVPQNSYYGKTIISINYNKENINTIELVLKSLLDQSVRVDAIYINIQSNIVIPEFVKKIAIINIIQKDYGNMENIIPILLIEEDSNTNIICLRDNIIYQYTLIEELIQASKLYPYKLICVDKKNYNKGILIKPKFFDIDLLHSNTVKDNITNSINNNIIKTGFKIFQI